MSETIYTRGTADEGYGQRRKVNAVGDQGGNGASMLQKFLSEQYNNSFFGMGLNAIGSAIGSGFSAADEATSGAVPRWNAANATAAAARTGASVEEAQAAGEQARTAAEEAQKESQRTTGMTPGLLSTTLGGVEYGWSNYVARPAATGAMLANTDSPLYRDGFQISDVRDSWDRSETVSFGRAAAALPGSPLNPLGYASQAAGFDNYDVWSDSDMESADENPFYNFFTGSVDAALQVVPLPMRPARLSMLRKAGIRGQEGVRGGQDLATIRTEYDAHRAWRESTATTGANVVPELSQEARDALGYYTQTGYGEINTYLRDYEEIVARRARTQEIFGDEMPTDVPEWRDNIVRGLDEATQASVAETDMIVYRGTGLPDGEIPTQGQTVSFPEFLSTTTDEGLAVRWTDGGGTVFPDDASRYMGESLQVLNDSNFFGESLNKAYWTIEVPAGSRFADMKALGIRSDQDEILLPRDSQLKINRVEEITDPESGEIIGRQFFAELQQDGKGVGAPTPQGRQTGVGFLVDNVAAETDPAKILESPLLRGVSGVDKVKLSNIYARTDDPDTVFSLYMAAKGEVQALQDLAGRAPQHIWTMADMDAELFRRFVDGDPFEPKPGQELNMVNQMFDSALDRDEYFLDVRRTLVDGAPLGRVADTNMPNGLWVEKIREANGRIRYAFKTSDYTGAPGWVQKIVESPAGGPTTQFIAWVGSRKPLGRVTRSGARPNDLIDEMDAWFSSVSMFRGNKRQIKVGTDADGNAILVPVNQFVAQQKARILQAQRDGNLEGVWREMENDTIAAMGLTLGYDAKSAEDLLRRADELRGEAKAVEDYLASTGGYLFSESQRVIYDDAATLSMLLDSFATTPLNDIFYYARKNLPERSGAANVARAVPRGGAELFDEVMKFFRTNVLLRVGYIPKNSIGEPFVASAIAHGTILTDEGLPQAMANFSKNRANEVRRAAYAADLATRIKRVAGNKDAKTRKQMRVELNNLVVQREDALAAMDLAQAQLDAVKSGVVSPSQSPLVAARARAAMFEAHKVIRSIEASLDGQVPEWRQVLEPASVAQVSERLRFYRALLNEDVEYLTDLREELGSIINRSIENTQLPSQRAAEQIEQLTAQIDEINATLEKYELDYRTPDIDVADVAVTQAGSQRDWANAKINRDFLQAQTRDAKRGGVKLNQPTAEVDAAIMQYRAKTLLEANDNVAVTQSADGIYDIDFDDVYTYQQYMAKFYPEVDNYTMVTVYRRAGDAEETITDTAMWSMNPASVVGEGGIISMDVPLLQLTKLAKGGRQFVPGRDQFVTLVPGRVPTEYRRSVKRLPEPNVAAGTDDYAAWQQLAKQNTGQVADEARLRGNAARGRDLQAIALRRQLSSLTEQRDALIAEKKRIDATGVDAFGEYRMSVSDKARAEWLSEQIDRLEQLQGKVDPDAINPMIRDLQDKYDSYIRSVDREVDASAEQRDAMIREVERIEAEMKSVQEQLGFKQAKVDSVSGDRVRYGSGRGDMVLNIGGEKFTVSGPLADDQYALGAGWRAEVSAEMTTRANYDPSFRAGQLTARLRDAGQVEVIDRFDPRYFNELAHVANVHFRNDQLIGQILEGKSKAEVIKWLRTPEGRNYQKSIGKDYLTNVEVRTDPMPALNADTTVRVLLESASTLDEIWNIVYAYLPTERVRKFVADRRSTGDFPMEGRSVGVSGAELEALLAGEENLSRILSAQGVWETYSGARQTLREAGAMYNRAIDKLWNLAMTKPETLLARNPFFTREFRRQMERRGQIIMDQAKERNVKITVDEWNRQLQGMRQSAMRDALTEMEKTFYNIRRYSSPVYAARFLTSFPGALFNSLYRYGRFAAREPERMLVGALALGDAMSVIGVDAEGNPVGEDNIGDAVYLVVPGTKKNPGDKGVQIPIGSIATMFVDMPQLSWAGAVAVSSIVAQNPKNDEGFRKAFDKVGLGWYYDDLFPFGPPSNPASSLFGSYQKDIWRWLRGPDDTDFIRSSVQFYADKMAEWERGGYEGDAPTFEEAIADTRAYYFAGQLEIGPLKLPIPNLTSRAVAKNISPVSIYTPPPGQAWRDAWYRHREAYPNDTEEARRTFMELNGDWARWYTYSSSEFTTYLPSSIDVFERVWEKYPHLVREMVSVAGDDAIGYVNLIALDADQTFNPSVNNYLRNNALPGDDTPVLRRIQPERFDNIVRVNDGWDLYGKEVVKHEAEQARLRELRDNAPTTEMADFYRSELYREEQAWLDWRDRTGPLASNDAWQISRNGGGKDHAANAALFLRKIVSDPKFQADEGKTEFWQNVKFFLDERDRAETELSRIRSSDDKAAFKAEFRAWVKNDFMPYAPEFLPTYERYFEKEWE